jgi:hypothetical protein
MLAALLENNNNTRPQAQSWKVKLDRSGPSRPRESIDSPHYELADIIAATASFPEIPGEHPVARAVRRHKWIDGALPFVKEAREKYAAAAFLAGASLATNVAGEERQAAEIAAEERHAAEMKLVAALKIEQLVEIIDSVRGVPPATSARLDRGNEGAGAGLFIGGLIVGGILAGFALSKRRQSNGGIRRAAR